MRRAFLYKLNFSSGKIYIGLTEKSLNERLKGHARSSFKIKSNLPVHNAWRKYGEPVSEILCIGEISYIKELERKAIQLFDCRIPNGYNVTFGGETSPMTAPEVAEKQRGENNPMKRLEVIAKRSGEGHHMKTKEQRARCSKQQKENNNMRSELARKRSSESHKGNRHSEETKLKMSLAAKGRPMPFEDTAELRKKRGAAISAGHAHRRAKLNAEKEKYND